LAGLPRVSGREAARAFATVGYEVTACALNFDHVSLAQKERMGATMTSLQETRWPEVERALLTACGFAPTT